ncbi:MAG: hypothetical protein R2731_01050 [Nocardioides sp.]
MSTEEIEAVSLDDGGDPVAERRLREALNTPEIFDLLRVPHRVGGFAPTGPGSTEPPTGHRSMPDIVLLAPAGRSFTSSPSTHGSFAYPTSRIPMVFCGPGMPEGRVTLDTADLVDFAPTVLSLLGIPTDGMDGRPLVDVQGRPRPVVRRQPARSAPRGSGSRPRPTRTPPTRDKRAWPAARVTARPERMREASADDLTAGLPTYVLADVVRPRGPGAADAADGTSHHPPRRLVVGDPRWAQLSRARPGGARDPALGRRGRLACDGSGVRPAPARAWPHARPERVGVAGARLTRGARHDPRPAPAAARAGDHHPAPGAGMAGRPGRRAAPPDPVLLDLGADGRPVLLSSDDFVAAVAGLARQLDPTEDPVPEPPIIEFAATASAYLRVVQATERLRSLLTATRVTRFTLTDGGLLG